MVQAAASTDRFVFSSSVSADAWRPQTDPKAYQWWYFDALSDDGDEAIVIVFLDNFIYSPRYNAPQNSSLTIDNSKRRHPAVSFAYYAGGKRVYRAESEFGPAEFRASETSPRCSIGNSGFRFDSASYGAGYLVSVDLPISRGRRLRAELEWLSIESDLAPAASCDEVSAHCWNMVAPRSDVSGKIIVEDSSGRGSDNRSFRGTGYHDHNLDNRWLASTVKEWHWGRAHFADSTAVFCRYAEIGAEESGSQLILVKHGKMKRHEAEFENGDYVRDRFGIRYPGRVAFASEEVRLETQPLKVIDSSFYHLRFLSSMKLTSGEREQETAGITEFIAPRALKYRWLNWLSDLRTGRNGRASRFW